MLNGLFFKQSFAELTKVFPDCAVSNLRTHGSVRNSQKRITKMTKYRTNGFLIKTYNANCKLLAEIKANKEEQFFDVKLIEKCNIKIIAELYIRG